MAVRDEKLERARRVARRKMDFLRHVIIYLLVMAVLAVINNVTGGGYQWWLWQPGKAPGSERTGEDQR
jgi:hypothetical protein